jgi:hypothetical protein
MGVLIAILIIWFWSESCFTKKERKVRRRVFWGLNALIWGKFAHDIWNIDKTTKL